VDTKITNIKLPWEQKSPTLPSSQISLWKQSPADLKFSMFCVSRYKGTISCVTICAGYGLCGLSDGTIGYREIDGEAGVINNGATLPGVKHTAAVVALDIDESEHWIFSGSKDGTVIIYDLSRKMILGEFKTQAPLVVMQHCQEQRRLFCGLKDGHIAVYDSSSMPMPQLLTIPDTPGQKLECVTSLDYDSSSGALFASSKEGVTLWSVKFSKAGCEGACWSKRIGQLPTFAQTGTGMAFMPSSREVVVSTTTGAVIIFDLDSGEATYALQGHGDEITSLLWLDAPRRLLTASKDKTLRIWDFPSLNSMSLDQQIFDMPAAPPAISTAPGIGSSSQASTHGAASRSGAEEPLFPVSRMDYQSTAAASGSMAAPTAAREALADPLAGSRGGPLGHAAPTASAAYPSSSSSRGPPSQDPLRAAQPVAPTPQRAAVVVGSKPGYTRADSDDDLVGWDR
jgi:WD40 repeat protein